MTEALIISLMLMAAVAGGMASRRTRPAPPPVEDVDPDGPTLVPPPTPPTTSPRQLRRLLSDSPVGVCVVSADAIITWIEGGALREVGTAPGDWLGLALAEPWLSRGFGPAMRGETVAFVALDPVGGERDQLIGYAPHYDGAGRIDGATVWWWVLPPGVRVDLTEDSNHG